MKFSYIDISNVTKKNESHYQDEQILTLQVTNKKGINDYFISMVMLSQLNLKDCGFLKIKANYQGSWV